MQLYALTSQDGKKARRDQPSFHVISRIDSVAASVQSSDLDSWRARPIFYEATASAHQCRPVSALSLNASRLWAQGPPYQTDDPVPVELHHYEFYIFGSLDGTMAEIDSTGPAIEFNWGAISRLQLHAILPMGVVAPSNNPIYAPGGIGRTFFGLTDMELGAKIAKVEETKHIPQIGTFTMFEVPTGSYAKGLGVGFPCSAIPTTSPAKRQAAISERVE